tara:strand:+ start:11301 stop:12737 length:1437 start_codon:yes stop_codon:yes gene_type:complete
MKIHSRSGKQQSTVQDRPTMVMYTCGPTVYDDSHIGNFRSFVMADSLRRWLESPLRVDNPPKVRHVMNITDIGHLTEDDIDRMTIGISRSGMASVELVAIHYTKRFIEDAKLLNIKVASEADNNPRLMPRASDYIQDIIDAIMSMIEVCKAYVTEDGVFFDVSSFPRHGEVAGDRLNDQPGMGGRLTFEQAAGKRNPEDFLLWKKDFTHLMTWKSPWGRGYPGWHIECSVMASAMGHDDMTGIIDIHTGGEDNAFPHHEAENAQSCSMFGRNPHKTVFSRHWFHVAHLQISDKKMSKSEGTFIRIKDLTELGVSAAAVRMFLLSAHYRTNLLYDGTRSIAQYERMLEKWRHIPAAQTTSDEFKEEFARALDNDFNTAEAIGVVNKYLFEISKEDWEEIERVFGLDGMFPKIQVRGNVEYREMSDEMIHVVEPLVVLRHKARQDKNFEESDRLRSRIAAEGFEIEDRSLGRYLVQPILG